MFRTEGDPALVLAHDELLARQRDDWFANEILHYLKRTLQAARRDQPQPDRAIEPGSCFAGSLLELALAADRSFQLDGVFEDKDPRRRARHRSPSARPTSARCRWATG